MLLENLKESRLAQSMSSDLPKDADLVERAVDIKAWYDGYHFGDFDVYCPWDVMNLYLLSIGYIDEGDLEEYRQKVSRLS